MAVTSRGAIVQCGDATGPGLAEREPRGPSPHRPRADRRDARRRARRLRQPVVLRLDRPRLHDPRPAVRRERGGDGHRAADARHRHPPGAVAPAGGAGPSDPHRAPDLRRPPPARRRRRLDEGRLRRGRRGLRHAHAADGEALALMRRLWQGEKVGPAQLNPWPAALGGPKLLIGSWAGSRWIPRAAKDFDGWIGSGARSNVAALRDGIKRFREAGGQRAIATNIPVDLEAPTAPMPEEGQFHLRCDPTTAAQRLRMLADLGFDDAVLVTRRYGDADLAA